MKCYGMRIGSTGVEFSSKDERDKALLCFTKGSTIKVNPGSGVIYTEEGDPAFGTYERESNEILSRCEECKGTFSAEGCVERTYYKKWYSSSLSEVTHHICDGCYAKLKKEKELLDAQEKIKEAQTS